MKSITRRTLAIAILAMTASTVSLVQTGQTQDPLVTQPMEAKPPVPINPSVEPPSTTTRFIAIEPKPPIAAPANNAAYGTIRLSTPGGLPLFAYAEGPPANGPSNHVFEEKTRALLTTYGSYAEADRPAFLEKLTAIITEHFDFKQTTREAELKHLEEQVKKLRALHEQRSQEKKEIVQDRVRQLLRETAGLGWGGGDHPTAEETIHARHPYPLAPPTARPPIVIPAK